jgi:hypothetical protein
MEIKFELDTKKATCAALAIAATYTLCHFSEHSDSPQLATANAIALIVIIAIHYGPRHKNQLNRHDAQRNHTPF